ncbi:hypothetical protein ACFVXC_05470 [Streptomyces sp. NPDC058257]|uniref:hypothetical protein n=1 Tax=Streptomyces sp. NPDC058257 TaxID=3346409 RepID=UPI0036ED4E73
MSELLKCAGCNWRVIEPDEDVTEDENGYANKRCADCQIQDCTCGFDDGLITLVADWETVSDDEGCTISPDMLPVIITVKATTKDEAIEAASDKLQAHFGTSVDALFETRIERDFWFGLNETDAFLRLCAVLQGSPAVIDEDAFFTVLS